MACAAGAAALHPLDRQGVLTTLGLAHFALGYFYAYRAGKLRPVRFALITAVSAWFLFGTGVDPAWQGPLRVFALSWFMLHLTCDELFLTGRGITGLRRVALGVLGLAVSAVAVRFWLSPMAGAAGMLVAGLGVVAVTVTAWRTPDVRVHSVLEFTLPAAVVLVLDAVWQPDLSWVAMSFITYHYLHWYVVYARKLRPVAPAFRRFVWHVGLANGVAAAGLLAWIFGGEATARLEAIYTPDAFYIWTLMHLFYTVRPPDLSALRRARLRLGEALHFRKTGRWLGAGLATGAVGALGYAGPGLLPLYILSMGGLAWVALYRCHLSDVILFALGVALGQIPAAFLGALPWGRVVALTIVVGMALCAVLPMVVWGRLARARGWSTSIVVGVSAFAWGALWQLLPDLAGWPVAMAAHFVAVPEVLAGARWVGVAGLSGLMVAASACGAVAVGPRLRWRTLARGVGAASAVVLFAMLLGTLARLTAPAAVSTHTVGIPQGNFSPTYYLSSPSNQPMRRDFQTTMNGLLRELEDVDLLVTPEEFDRVYYAHLPAQLARWQDRARRLGQHVILGAPALSSSGRENTLIAVDKTGAVRGTHRKVSLAMGGETHKAAGTGFMPVTLEAGASVGMLVCIEAGLADGPERLAQSGASLLVTATNDASFGAHAIVFLHLAMARLRAASVGRPMVWASNAGPSGIIDRFGGFQAAAPLNGVAAARGIVQGASDVTPFLASRAVWLWVYALLLVACGIPARRAAQTTLRVPVGRLSWLGPVATVVVCLCVSAAVTGRHVGAEAALRAIMAPLPATARVIADAATQRAQVAPPDGTLATGLSIVLQDAGIPVAPSQMATWLGKTGSADAAQAVVHQRLGVRLTTQDLDALSRTEVRGLTRNNQGRWLVVRSTRKGDLELFDPSTLTHETVPAWSGGIPKGLQVLALTPYDAP